MHDTTLVAKRLLLVDDQPRNLALLEVLLRPLGHDLHAADGGRSAIELFEKHPPDLVLLDLVMPEVDGLAVLRHIRRKSSRPHVPVILVTAHSEREHRLRGLEAGADEFLEKPIDRAILLARVRTLLQLKASRDELQTSRDVLAERNASLERLQREQRELTQFIVHDLKNPLAVVAGNLQWALESLAKTRFVDPSEPSLTAIAESLAEANGGALRMRSMIEDLLTIARFEHAEFPVRPEVVSIADLLHSLVETYGRKAEQKNISLLLSTPPEAQGKVRADPSLFRRVLENILDNALRYTPSSGRIRIATRSERAFEIRVSNSGPSIPNSLRRRIFEKFVRGDLKNEAVGNAGLGLYFCKCAVEAHGGQIDVEETADWPTSFVIQLPLPD
jgi:signal transduction histidine kinase